MKEIRKENTSIPIIFLTAKSQTKDILDGFDHGGNDYLKKPFSMEELIVRIKALLYRNEIKKDTLKIAIADGFKSGPTIILFTAIILFLIIYFHNEYLKYIEFKEKNTGNYIGISFLIKNTLI